MDQLQPYLKTVFGFMGISDITFINVSPVQFANAELRQNAIANSKVEIIEAVNALVINQNDE